MTCVFSRSTYSEIIFFYKNWNTVRFIHNKTCLRVICVVQYERSIQCRWNCVNMYCLSFCLKGFSVFLFDVGRYIVCHQTDVGASDHGGAAVAGHAGRCGCRALLSLLQSLLVHFPFFSSSVLKPDLHLWIRESKWFTWFTWRTTNDFSAVVKVPSSHAYSCIYISELIALFWAFLLALATDCINNN